MNLRQLKYFVRVLDAGNMTRAADHLNMAQTALGAQIRGLEEELGTVLLVRHSRGIAPTRAGSHLYARALEILKLVDDTAREVARCESGNREAVRLGVTPALMMVAGTDLALIVREQLPLIDLSIIEAMSHVLVETLARGDVDYILCYDVPDMPQFARTALLQDDLVLVTQLDGDAGKPIALVEVAQRALAMPEAGDSVRTTATRAARDLGLELKVAHEVRSITAMKALAARGVACSILPYFSVLEEVQEGRLGARPIVQPALRRTLFLASRQGGASFAHGSALTGAVRLSLLGLLDALGPLAQSLWRDERNFSEDSAH